MAKGPEGQPVVALLTDFGPRDAYAGAVKGVILRACPEARLVDVTHEVPPQDVRAGAFVLESAFRYFPEGTVFVAVVDPGVGGGRRILAAEAAGYRFTGPDNGLLSLALERAGGARVFAVSGEALRRAQGAALPAGAQESSTFHGRDRFAPVGAVLAGGVPPGELGPEVDDYERIRLPVPERLNQDRAAPMGPPNPPRMPAAGGAGSRRSRRTVVSERLHAGETRGEVIYVDGFGNLVTNLRPADLPPDPVFEAAGRAVEGLARAYVERERGGLLAVVGSTGRVEISVREGSAALALGAGIGTPVIVREGGDG